MKAVILLLLGATIAIMKADDSVDRTQLAREVASDADTLRGLLSEDWTVQSTENEITITSKFEVFLIGLVSRSDSAPKFSDDTSRKTLVKETQPEKYVIHLRFEQPMSREEFERRRNERQKAADVLNFGAPTKDEHQAANDRYTEIEVPRYRTVFHDVFQKTPATTYAGIYPPKSLQKVGGAKEVIAAVLYPMRTGND